MKSMKLASGFAISALAMAIAGTAVAQDTTTTVDFTGSVKVNTTFDFETERAAHGFPGYYDASEDWYNLNAEWRVTNGPFSGRIIVGIDEDDSFGDAEEGAEGEYNAGVKISHLRVDQGPFSFGQIGRITDTAGLYEGFTDQNDMFGEDTGTRIGVDAAFRYSVDDLGLRVQAEGNEGYPFGAAVALNQDFDVAEIWLDAQFRQRSEAAAAGDATLTGMEDPETTFGAAVALTPVDMVTLTGVVRTSSVADRLVYAVNADVAATDNISAFVLLTDRDAGEDTDSLLVRFGATTGFAPFTVSAGYEALAAEFDAGLVFTNLSYSDGAIGASAELNYALDGFTEDGYVEAQEGDFELVLGADYTFDTGVVFGSEYTFTGDDWYDGKTNQLELLAKYSF